MAPAAKAEANAAARRLLEGLFDTWLVDFKFGNDACGRRLAGVPHYLAAVGANLRWRVVANDGCTLTTV